MYMYHLTMIYNWKKRFERMMHYWETYFLTTRKMIRSNYFMELINPLDTNTFHTNTFLIILWWSCVSHYLLSTRNSHLIHIIINFVHKISFSIIISSFLTFSVEIFLLPQDDFLMFPSSFTRSSWILSLNNAS